MNCSPYYDNSLLLLAFLKVRIYSLPPVADMSLTYRTNRSLERDEVMGSSV